MKKIILIITLLMILTIPSFSHAAVMMLVPGSAPYNPDQLSVMCSYTTVSNNTITWVATPYGGVLPYLYLWSGDSNISGSTSNPISATYSATGTYRAVVTVKDSRSNNATATCSATVKTMKQTTSFVTTSTNPASSTPNDVTPPIINIPTDLPDNNRTNSSTSTNNAASTSVATSTNNQNIQELQQKIKSLQQQIIDLINQLMILLRGKLMILVPPPA